MKSKLIVALDVESYQDATALVQVTRNVVDIFKVGSQLFTRVGPRIIEFLHEHGKECFLDLKFHDIPHTVAGAVESATALRVSMLTLHTSGGAEMLEAAAAIHRDYPRARLIALTTYGGDEDIRRALQAGVQAYLMKDILHDELLKAIRAVHDGQTYLPASVAAALAAQMPRPDLSARELQVLELIVAGLANKQIAYTLNIAEYTVKNHVKNILDKLAVQDRTQAATVAIQRGIIHLS